MSGKTKKVAWICILSLMITSCSKAATKEEIRNDQTKAEEVTSIENTKLTEKIDYPDYTYSEHPKVVTNGSLSESEYITKLVDLTKLDGKTPQIAYNENKANWNFRYISGLGVKDDFFGYDIRSSDASKLDLSNVVDDSSLTFNTQTRWPEVLPEGFDPEQLLEFNRNPGLGIRALHEQGITGEGVSIAIIDQPLLLTHEQYKDNLVFYERIHTPEDCASMHGPAVASIAVGKDIGVAPGANLYFIANTYGHYLKDDFEFDASMMGDCILRVLQINEHLAEKDKIRVISISRGFVPSDKGYDELIADIKQAEDRGILVLTCTTSEYHKDFKLYGMARDYHADPDKIESYVPPEWATDKFYTSEVDMDNMILVPMGSRTTADPNGDDSYELNAAGGFSWTVPWCAGLYALCCQVKPDITPQEFIDLARKTSVITEHEHDGKTYKFGNIINPKGMIEELQK